MPKCLQIRLQGGHHGHDGIVEDFVHHTSNVCRTSENGPCLLLINMDNTPKLVACQQ